MANYTPPNNNSIPFNFTSSGYTKPDFNDIEFNYSTRPSYTGAADLAASIEVMGLYQDSTYTYTKECRNVIVGYTYAGVQTLELPCLFGGIRDLGSYLNVLPPNIDLSADIYAIFAYSNLATLIRVVTRDTKDLVVVVKGRGIGSVDLGTFQRVSYRQSKDLFGYTKFVLGSKVPIDLTATLYDIQPIDIQGLLNVIEIRNIAAQIEGVWWKGQKDLSANFYKFHLRSNKILNASLMGWAKKDLQARIISFWKKDLNAEINAGFFAIHVNILATLSTIQPVNLYGLIHSYATFNLQAKIQQGYTDNDIQGVINTIQPVDLKAYISSFYGIKKTKDLKAYISSFMEIDLKAIINTIEYKLLIAYINASGKYKDLTVFIAPKTINIKRILLVPLFEHKDLLATINYNCRLSGFKDLSARMYLLFRKDLRVNIIGWNQGTADNLRDLKAYINIRDYQVQGTMNISFSGHSYHSEIHNVAGGKSKNYKLFDTCTVLGGPALKNLIAYVNIVPEFLNLKVYVKAQPLANFTTLPDWVKPKTREVVINLDRFEHRWKRFVDLMFFTNSDRDYHYFFVSGNNSIYKIDKNRTWTIWVSGYNYDKHSLHDKINTRKKFIFNLKNYNTVDEAVRYMINSVSEFRERDLSANINGILGNYCNLSVNIQTIYSRSWVTYLRANVTALVKASYDLTSYINPS